MPHCLVLDDGKTHLAIVVCDSCMIPRSVVDNAKHAAATLSGIPADKILVSATHTHTAPTVGGVFQSDPDEGYQKYLAEQIALGIAKASQNLTPAKIGWGVGQNPTQVYNRRWKMKAGSIGPDPFGRTTDTVRMNPGYLAAGSGGARRSDRPGRLFRVRPDTRRQAIGLPRELFAPLRRRSAGMSADYFGIFAEKIKGLLGAENVTPPFVGIMSNGTSGDINNVNFAKAVPGKQGPYEQAQLVADSVARTAFEAHQNVAHQNWVPLAMAQKEIELGVRLPSEEDVARASAILAKAKKPVLSGLNEVYAHETVLLAKYPPKVKALVQAVRIGDLGIASSPCETFVEIGLQIKKKSPFKGTFTIELANGYNGYLPTPQQHAWGGYETWRARSSYLEVNASETVTATILDLLKEVAR